jgi:hypothetical protein
MTKSDQTKMKNIGIWIDHKEAVLVSVEKIQAKIERIESNAESHFRASGGWKASGTNVAQSVSKEQKADARRMQQYRNFYKEVIEKAGKDSNIYIFGPGEAKLELKKEIEKIKGQQARIAAVEASDRLTENQIVAKVKSFFTAL